MNFEEHAAKALLKARGMPVPSGRTADSPDAAADAARALGGPCVVKAQAPTGKRGKAGGIRPVDTPDEARAAAAEILGMTIDGHRIDRLLVEAADRDRGRALRRGVDRLREPRTGPAVLRDGRHGGRGDRGRRPRGRAPDRGRYRRRADSWAGRRRSGGNRPRPDKRRRFRGFWPSSMRPIERWMRTCWRSIRSR